jgi:hypothetical protein
LLSTILRFFFPSSFAAAAGFGGGAKYCGMTVPVAPDI